MSADDRDDAATDGVDRPAAGVPGPLGAPSEPDIMTRAAGAGQDEDGRPSAGQGLAAGQAGPVDPEPDMSAEVPAGRDADPSAGSTPGEQLGGDVPAGEQPPLRAVLEAVLLVTDEPVPAVTLAQVAERPTGEVEAVLRELAEEYAAAGRGFELCAVAGGWRLYTRADCAPYVERFVLDGQQARLTQAALETLAVIAYRQPVTRSRVSAVRGVNVDGVVRTLVARGLVTEAGQDAESGATLYVTTGLLLEKLGLESLAELPSLAPLLPELDDLPEGSIST